MREATVAAGVAGETDEGERSPPAGRGWDALEPDLEEMRCLVDTAVARVLPHIASLGEQRAANVDGAEEVARALRESVPELGSDLGPLLELLFDRAIPKSFNTASPGYLAYIPGGGLFASALAAFIADAVNRYVGVFAAAPALAQLEANVVRWFGEIVGYPPEARDFLTSGGSLANFSGIATARRERLPDDFLRGTIYVSDQTHHSVLKAAMLAGFPPGNVRSVPSDEAFRAHAGAMAEAIARDRADGWQPFLIVGNAGTTNSGAVDPLPELADLAAAESLWLHVDASYGGFFAMTERGRNFLQGLERADSLVLDSHKTLFLPYGSGCLLVRDGEALRRAHSVSADYMPTIQDDPDLVDFCEISPELSRGFRGLRVWLPMKLYGLGSFRAALDEKLDLSDWIAARLTETDHVEIVAAPQVTVTAWRLVPPGIDGSDRASLGVLNGLNRDLMARINARGRVYLTATLLDGAFVIRVCVVSMRTHMDRMQMALDDIRAAIAQTLEDFERGESSDTVDNLESAASVQTPAIDSAP